MAETFFAGPAIALGPLIGGGDSKQGNPWSGPGAEYQGACVLDPRFYPANKDGVGSGRIPAFMNHSYFVVADNFPSAISTTGLAAAAATVGGTPMTLTTVAPGGSGSGVPSLGTAIPLIPLGGSSTPVTVLALDFGFTTGNTTAGTASIPVPDSTLFTPGQWICIGGAGNAAKTLPLLTQVQTIPDATHVTTFPVVAGTLTNAPIGSANLYGLFPSGAVPTAANPYVNGGALAVFNPLEGLARCVSITGNAGSSANNVTVKGYDVFGQPMSELIAFAGGATTKFGQKAFKYIASITPATTDAGHLVSAGWGDTFGFHARSDKWEYTNIFYNGTFVTASTGWLKGDTTNPATTSTGDVRGTVQVGAGGNGTPISGNTPTTGSLRLTLFMSIPVFNMLNATPANPAPLFGVTQV